MDPRTVENLLELLQEGEMTWRGAGHGARIIEELRQITGQDLGHDPAAWLSWWGAMAKVMGKPAPAPKDASREAALSALREMGVVDEQEFAAWTGTFSHIARGLAFYLASCDGPSLRIAHTSARCWTEAQRARLEKDLVAFIRSGGCAPQRIELARSGSSEIVLRVDEVELPLGDYPARGIFRALHGWCQGQVSERRPWLDAANRLWWLTEANALAIRRYGVVRLRRIHAREPGAPHAEVSAAWRRLELLGLRLDRARKGIGWEVDLFDEKVHARRHSYETQLLDLEGEGVLVSEIDLGHSLDAAALALRLSRLVGFDLDATEEDEFFDLPRLLMHLNGQLRVAARSWQLVALRSRRHWVRIVRLPPEVVGAFTKLVEVIAGLESFPPEARADVVAPRCFQHG